MAITMCSIRFDLKLHGASNDLFCWIQPWKAQTSMILIWQNVISEVIIKTTHLQMEIEQSIFATSNLVVNSNWTSVFIHFSI